MLAKLYSTVFYARVQDLLDLKLEEEQFGFRKGRGCTDAIHILRMIVEKVGGVGRVALHGRIGRGENF